MERPFGNDKKNRIPDTGASVEGVTSLMALTWNDRKKGKVSPDTIGKLGIELVKRRKWLEDYWKEDKILDDLGGAIGERHIEMILLILRELQQQEAEKAIEELEPERRQRLLSEKAKTIELLREHDIPLFLFRQ